MLQISLFLAAFIGYMFLALALIQVVRDTKKGGHVWGLYVWPRLPRDCEEGDYLEANWEHAEITHRDNTDLGPTTREFHGMERFPIFRPRHVTGGLRVPTKCFGRVKQPEEVFDEEFLRYLSMGPGNLPLR